MATQAIGKFAATSAVDSSAATNTHEQKLAATDEGAIPIPTDDYKRPPSDTESSDLGEGIFRQHIEKDGKQVLVVWSKQEETHVVRKADFLFLPLFSVGKTTLCWNYSSVSDCPQLMFTWMAIDRTNVSGVLTSTFLHDTAMTRDQANTGVSLLWLGIVLLEIPSNVSCSHDQGNFSQQLT